MPADQTVTVLDGADGAVDQSIGRQQAQLKAAPPTAQRPSGAPQTLDGKPPEQAAAPQVSGQLERVAPPGQGQQQKADGQQVQGQNPAQQVQTPNVPDTDTGNADAHDVQNMQDAVNDVPSTDPGLNVTVGPAPQVQLTGDADPKLTDQQAGKYNDKTTTIQDTGRQDAAKPLGEDHIYPDVPDETLRGNVPGGVGGQGGGPGKSGEPLKPGEATVVQQQRGPQIKQAIGQGQGQVRSAQTKNKQQQAEARKKNQSDIDKETADNARKQTDKRGEVGVQATQARDQWRSEQDKKVADSDQQADQSHTENNQKILSKRDDSNKQVKDRQTSDNKKIEDNRQQAQQKAQDEKDKKKHESSGWFGWITSKIKDAFNALLSAVTKIFDFFRKLVNDIIDGFKKFADSVIDTCRKLAVDLIKAVADTLIKICDVLLAAFPALRDKFRKAIEALRDAAIAAVNALADALKAAVNKLLDALGAALNALLKLAEATLKAIINQVRAAVEAAINFVKAAIAALGQLAALIADIAPDPGGWLKKMGAAAMDGIQHHLWGAIKTAVKAWFDQKVESVVGLTSTLLNILIKGCVSLKKIGQMAWKAIISALPMMLAQIIIEKVISMIVPAAGAILTIIQGLMAAWGTVSKIIAAFGKFFAFLKAVKAGPAACLFAEAVAAGVVALLEFVSQYLLSKLKGAGKAVGTKLKALAQKIMKALAKAGKGARKAVGTAVNRARTGLRNALSSVRERFPSRRRPAESTFGEHPHERPGEPHATPRHPEEGRPRTHHSEERPTDTKRPAEHEDPKSTKPHEREEPKPSKPHEPEEPKKPRRPERPKEPARPKRPVSRVGRALNRAKGAVKGALAKARNAARALGRKLKNSKLGRAIRNGAHKVYDAYKRKRDQFRDWWNKHKEDRQRKREERHKKENSPQAKSERLEKVVARIRPRIESMLRRGVRGAVLRGLLAAMRVWYRLTGLELSGGERFGILATLNPSVKVTNGLTVDEQQLLEMLNELSAEILQHPTVRAGAGRISQSGSTANTRRFTVPEGVGLASMASFMTYDSKMMVGSSREKAYDIFHFATNQRSDEMPVMVAHHVSREPNRISQAREDRIAAAPDEQTRQAQRELENADRFAKGFVKPRISKVRRDGTVAEQNKEGLPYRNKVTKSGRVKKGIGEGIFGDSDHGREVLSVIGQLARGERVGGTAGRDAAFVGSLVLAKEVQRNPRTAVTGAMVMQMAMEGKLVTGVGEMDDPKTSFDRMKVDPGKSFEAVEALKYMPMEGVGAMEQTRNLNNELADRGPFRPQLADRPFAGGQTMANREILAIQMWVKSLDIKTDEGGEMRTLAELKSKIREKMYELYGLK
ncbi:hypothetical protein [Streptomyces roseochromogenus]|uniref:hypothetical protein n=1 Tax=Streptomyces roseochromogenus TaxID=285450 RepID=UPI001ADFC3BF|nr:hypothetical protein [Streptomyces roseochromogenus]